MVRSFYDALLCDLLPRVVLVRLDRRANPDVARRAQVYQGPALLVLDPRRESPLGNPVKKLIGGRDAKKVAAVLKQVLENWTGEER
jgi:hypothetical protein